MEKKSRFIIVLKKLSCYSKLLHIDFKKLNISKIAVKTCYFQKISHTEYLKQQQKRVKNVVYSKYLEM